MNGSSTDYRVLLTMSQRKNMLYLLISLILILGGWSPAFGKNLHLIEQLPNGFKIYRSGAPSNADLRELHTLGITEMAVLSGDADRYERPNADLVPALTIVYDQQQEQSIPLTVSFLKWFDQWVEDARTNGKAIAFRCQKGSHRTGRLAAYYQMKYQNLTGDDAWMLLDSYGENMWLHGNLKFQVISLMDYINNQPCSQDPKYCVIDDSKNPY